MYPKSYWKPMQGLKYRADMCISSFPVTQGTLLSSVVAVAFE